MTQSGEEIKGGLQVQLSPALPQTISTSASPCSTEIKDGAFISEEKSQWIGSTSLRGFIRLAYAVGLVSPAVAVCTQERLSSQQLLSLRGRTLQQSRSDTEDIMGSQGAAGYSPCWKTGKAGCGVKEGGIDHRVNALDGKKQRLFLGETLYLICGHRHHLGEDRSHHQRGLLWVDEPESSTQGTQLPTCQT